MTQFQQPIIDSVKKHLYARTYELLSDSSVGASLVDHIASAVANGFEYGVGLLEEYRKIYPNQE